MKRRVMEKILSWLMIFTLVLQQTGFAQGLGQLDISKYIGAFSGPEQFRPLLLRYFSYDPLTDNFQLLLDKGNLKKIEDSQLKEEGQELLKYFLVGVALPDDNFWVNLRPDSEEQIISQELAGTDLGKVLLEADLQLKKDVAKFTSPETAEGREYWNKLYAKAGEIFRTQNITIPTLTRPWIVPGEVIIRESANSAYVYKGTLKVMLEQDHLKNSADYKFSDPRLKELNEYSSQIIRETIIPKLTKEVNSSQRYASLRQVFFSLILSRWFKHKFAKEKGQSPAGTVPSYINLIDSQDLTNLTSKTPWSKSTYFEEYKKSFSQGEYNLKEQVNGLSGPVIRTYFSGGVDIRRDLSMPTSVAASPIMRFRGRNPLVDDRLRNHDMVGLSGMPGEERYLSDLKEARPRARVASSPLEISGDTLPRVSGGAPMPAPAAVVRPDLLEKFPKLFGDQMVNGRPLNVEQVIGELTAALEPEIDQLLRERIERERASEQGARSYYWADPATIVTDPNDQTATAAAIRKGQVDHFLGRQTHEAWHLNPTIPVDPRFLEPGLEITGPSFDLGMLLNQFNVAKRRSREEYAQVLSLLGADQKLPPAELDVLLDNLEGKRAVKHLLTDDEDTRSDYLYQLYEALENRRALLAGEWDNKAFQHPGKGKPYQLEVTPDQWPVFVQRLPGLHLKTRDNQITVNGRPVPSFLVHLVIHWLTNYDNMTKRKMPLANWIAKVESWQEALLVGKAFKLFQEKYLGVPYGTIKGKTLNERGEYVLDQELINWVLREMLIATSDGRWDYGASRQRMFRNDPTRVFPNIHAVGMMDQTFHNYHRRNGVFMALPGINPETGRLEYGAAVGGMFAGLKNRPAPNDTSDIVQEKERYNIEALHSIFFDKVVERLGGLYPYNDKPISNYRQAWVATTDSQYAIAGAIPLLVDLAPGQTLEKQLALLQILLKLLDEAQLGHLKRLDLIDETGKIKLIEVTEETLTRPDSIYAYSDQAFEGLFASPKGEWTEEGLDWALFEVTEYIYQQHQGRDAAAIEDPFRANKYDGIIRRRYTGNRIMSDQATDEGNYNFLVNTLYHGLTGAIKLTQDGPTTKKGETFTPELFMRLWDKRWERVRALAENVERAGGFFNHDIAALDMEIVKRMMVQTDDEGVPLTDQQGRLMVQKRERQPRYLSKVLFSLIEKESPELRKAILNAIFNRTRDELLQAVQEAADGESRELAMAALKAHDYVYDIVPEAEAQPTVPSPVPPPVPAPPPGSTSSPLKAREIVQNRTIFMGNWKDRKKEIVDTDTGIKRFVDFTEEEIRKKAREFKQKFAGAEGLEGAEIGILPEAKWVKIVAEELAGTKIAVGVQSSFFADPAKPNDFTPKALQAKIDAAFKMGALYANVGHSMHRKLYINRQHREKGEPEEKGLTDKQANKIMQAILKDGRLIPWYTIEVSGERDPQDEIADGINIGLNGITKEQIATFPITPEPSGKISTKEGIGVVDTIIKVEAEDTADLARLILQALEAKFGGPVEVNVGYGASVKPENSKAIFGNKEIRNALIGGASLEAEDFLTTIVNGMKGKSDSSRRVLVDDITRQYQAAATDATKGWTSASVRNILMAMVLGDFNTLPETAISVLGNTATARKWVEILERLNTARFISETRGQKSRPVSWDIWTAGFTRLSKRGLPTVLYMRNDPTRRARLLVGAASVTYQISAASSPVAIRRPQTNRDKVLDKVVAVIAEFKRLKGASVKFETLDDGGRIALVGPSDGSQDKKLQDLMRLVQEIEIPFMDAQNHGFVLFPDTETFNTLKSKARKSAGSSPVLNPGDIDASLRSASMPETANLGGIDFRAIPMITQPMGNLSGLNFSLPKLSNLENINLDEELAQIQKLLQAGITPSEERLKEFVAACYQKGEIKAHLDGIVACIVDTFKLQEEKVDVTSNALKEVMLILDSIG